MSQTERAKKLPSAANLFYSSSNEEQDTDDANLSQTLNMNDVWAWALAWGEPVSNEELPELGRLFYEYGWPGVLYWVSQKNGGMRSEFYDNNRRIEFVENEERILKEFPGSSDRAYHKETYTIQGDRKMTTTKPAAQSGAKEGEK